MKDKHEASRRVWIWDGGDILCINDVDEEEDGNLRGVLYSTRCRCTRRTNVGGGGGENMPTKVVRTSNYKDRVVVLLKTHVPHFFASF